MARRNSESFEELGGKIMKVATKKPLSAAELANKLTNHRSNRIGRQYTARGIGRALAHVVDLGDLSKTDERTPRYAKVA